MQWRKEQQIICQKDSVSIELKYIHCDIFTLNELKMIGNAFELVSSIMQFWN